MHTHLHTYHICYQYFINKYEEKNRKSTHICTLIRFIIWMLLKTKPETMIRDFNTVLQFSLNKAIEILLIPKNVEASKILFCNRDSEIELIFGFNSNRSSKKIKKI